MPDPIKISVVSTQKSSNKQKGNKGKYKSKFNQSVRSTRNKGQTIDFMDSQNKQKGEKGKYKSKSTRLVRHRNGTCTMSTNKVRGEKGKYKTRTISKARCSKLANKLTRKHSKK